MKMPLFAAVFALMPAPGFPALAQTEPDAVGAVKADPLAQSGSAFARAVYMNDKFEILAGRMAVEKGSPAVRDFGRHMIAAHTDSSEDLKAVLDHNIVGQRVTPPPVLDPRHMAMYHELEASWGRTFDRIYLAQQRAVHEEALDVMEGYLENGRVVDLQDFAHHMVPVVRDHLAMLRDVRGDIAAN
ncbi:MAG: DUF4142 domain-containing protein [Alphaproteobacteria bacterium]|nr:DUF4142 domain-containing protein [Alphaproteobacteria bacterium]